jgi:hypothetical protein
MLVLGTLACAATVACNDIPGIPKWDADWFIPLPSQTINLPDEANNVPSLPPNAEFPIDFPIQQQAMDESFANFKLDETLREGTRIELTLRKPSFTQIGTSDTLYIGESDAALVSSNGRTIRVILSMGVSDTMVVQTLTISPANLDMIQDVARSGGNLSVQLRGRAVVGPSGHTFSSNDQLGVRVVLFARVAMSR